MKLYKINKPVKGKAVGDVVEMSPDDILVQTLLESGHIEEARGVEEQITSKALNELTKGLVDTVAPAISKAMDEVVSVARKGIRIDPGDQQDDKTKSRADFFQCVGVTGIMNEPGRYSAQERLEKVYGAPPSADFKERYAKAEAARTGTSYKAALAEASGITGGYLVPPEYGQELLELSAENTVLVGKTDEYPMTGRELVMPILDQTTAPTAGNTAYFGGVVMSWTSEAATRSETEPIFKDARLVANELSGYALASRNVILDNKFALDRRLTQLFAGAIGWYRDYAYLQGNGVGKPQGIVNANATIAVTRTTTSTIKYDDLANMYGSFLPQSQGKGMWIVSQSVLKVLLKLQDGSSRLVFQPYYPGTAGGPAAVNPPMTIFGMPIVVTEKLPALGAKGDILLVDPKYYWSGTTQSIEIAASEHYKFINNQVTYRALWRGDGRSWLDAPVTLQDTSTTVSPFVAIAA